MTIATTRGLLTATLVCCLAQGAWAQTALPNLALNKKVTVSSFQDENPAANAVDGDEGTRWCAADGTLPQDIYVYVGAPMDIGGVTVRWEKDGAHYQYLVEGSADRLNWTTLNDQQDSTDTAQVQKLLVNGKGLRYVRVTITGCDEGNWASICELTVHSPEAMTTLKPEELKGWLAPTGPDVAKGKPTSSSSDEDGHPSADAVDGDEGTRWCANGADVPAWWQVDLKKPVEVQGLSVFWEKADTNYKWKVEGSADGKEWKLLSDQTQTTSTKQGQKVRFAEKGIQFVRLTVTEAPEGCWPSFFEVKVFGQE